MELDAKIFVAGHRGLVGGAILRRLQAAGFTNLLGRSSRQLDLRDQAAVARFFRPGAAGLRLSGRGPGGRHPGQLHLSGPIYL